MRRPSKNMLVFAVEKVFLELFQFLMGHFFEQPVFYQSDNTGLSNKYENDLPQMLPSLSLISV